MRFIKKKDKSIAKRSLINHDIDGNSSSDGWDLLPVSKTDTDLFDSGSEAGSCFIVPDRQKKKNRSHKHIAKAASFTYPPSVWKNRWLEDNATNVVKNNTDPVDSRLDILPKGGKGSSQQHINQIENEEEESLIGQQSSYTTSVVDKNCELVENQEDSFTGQPGWVYSTSPCESSSFSTIDSRPHLRSLFMDASRDKHDNLLGKIDEIQFEGRSEQETKGKEENNGDRQGKEQEENENIEDLQLAKAQEDIPDCVPIGNEGVTTDKEWVAMDNERVTTDNAGSAINNEGETQTQKEMVEYNNEIQVSDIQEGTAKHLAQAIGVSSSTQQENESLRSAWSSHHSDLLTGMSDKSVEEKCMDFLSKERQKVENQLHILAHNCPTDEFNDASFDSSRDMDSLTQITIFSVDESSIEMKGQWKRSSVDSSSASEAEEKISQLVQEIKDNEEEEKLAKAAIVGGIAGFVVGGVVVAVVTGVAAVYIADADINFGDVVGATDFAVMSAHDAAKKTALKIRKSIEHRAEDCLTSVDTFLEDRGCCC